MYSTTNHVQTRLNIVHTYRLKSCDSDRLLFIVNGSWCCSPVPPAALQGTFEKSSTLCKYLLMQCEWQLSESKSRSIWLKQKQKVRVVYYSISGVRIVSSADTGPLCWSVLPARASLFTTVSITRTAFKKRQKTKLSCTWETVRQEMSNFLVHSTAAMSENNCPVRVEYINYMYMLNVSRMSAQNFLPIHRVDVQIFY